MKEESAGRGTVKTSAILIANGRRTAVYRTVDEVPIADRRGAQELLRANIRALIEERIVPAPGFRALVWDDTVQVARFVRAHWLGFTIPVLSAVLLWAIFR